MRRSPQFSIVTPVFNPPLRVLEAMLQSVRVQTCGDWQHCLVDDSSTDPEVRRILDAAAAADARVVARYAETQSGIVAATNDALGLATGEFVAFLDHDDELHARALERAAAAAATYPDVDVLYTNEDKIDDRGRHSEPFIKPDWSPDRLRAQMYVGHLSVLRRSLVDDLGGLRPGFDGSQDWDLMLRATERARRIVHVPEILYHWRTLATSVAARSNAKPWAHEASHRAISDHLERTQIQGSVEPVPGFPGQYWLRPGLLTRPLVSIVIPTAGTSRDSDTAPLVVSCVRSVIDWSTYENIEFVVVVDAPVRDDVRDELTEVGGERLTIVDYDEPFNFSAKINLGVARATGEMLLLLNDDVEVFPGQQVPGGPRTSGRVPQWPITTANGRRSWIESMLVYALQPHVGAVGAKLYFPDGRLQHAGVISPGGAAGHPYYRFPGDDPGYWGNLIVPANYLAVTGACLMTSRDAFHEVGGFDEALPLNYNDVDYCLKLRSKGRRAVVPPEVELLHRESVTRGRAAARREEVAMMQQRWSTVLFNDPYYDTRFADGDFTIAGYSTRGEFRSRKTPSDYVDRVRRAYIEGGPTLVMRQVWRKTKAAWDRLVRSSA